MKKNLLILSVILGIAIAATFVGCAKSGIKDPVTLDKAAGKWSINAIRYQIYTGSSTPKDSTIPWRPVVENFITFDGVSSFQYCFNNASATGGGYSFISEDSISISLDAESTRWKILLLTPTNFNIERTSNTLHDFPGATVVTYQSFVR